jgi:hypothetical protein
MQAIPESPSVYCLIPINRPDYYNKSNKQMYRLEESIARLEKAAMENGINISKNEDGSYTMGDVLNVVDKIQKLHRTPPGTMGKIRRFFRGVGKEAPVMQQWVNCIPQDAYGSAICGGFTIILSVWKPSRSGFWRIF